MSVRPESDADAAAEAMSNRPLPAVPLIPPETAAARAESLTRALRAAAEVLKMLRCRRSTAPYDRREIEAAERAVLYELAHAKGS
jgi:hypothetical protein